MIGALRVRGIRIRQSCNSTISSNRHSISCHSRRSSTKSKTTFNFNSNDFTTTSSSPLRTFSYCILGGAVVGSVASARYVYDQVGGNMEGLRRSLSFYKLAIPTYLQYRLLQYQKSPDEAWHELDQIASREGLDKILELQGFYIKCGQMAAANIGNAFPKVWQTSMSILQDNCPSRSLDEVKEIIHAEYGSDTAMTDVFEWFDPIPIGSASIGQVHRAKLRDGGREVAVKIQYPDVERLFRGDVRTLIMFCKVAQPVHVPALEEIEQQFMTEFDYRAEARHLEQVRSNMINAGFNKYCEVPKSHPEYCTKRILMMDYIPGDKLAVGLERDLERLAARTGKRKDELKLTLRQAKDEDTAIITGKGTGGPSAKEFDQYLTILNAQRRIKNMQHILYNIALAWWLPGAQYKVYGEEAPPINHARLIDTLFEIHGHQILVNGYFNGDPHPGNLLLMNHSNRLGLIDYGQVKQLTKRQRLQLCKLTIALANDDKEEVVRVMTESGFRTKRMDADIVYLYSKVSFDEDNARITNGLHIQEFMEYLDAKDPVEHLVKDFVMVSRVTILLRGVAHALQQGRSVAKVWKPIAERVLLEETE